MFQYLWLCGFLFIAHQCFSAFSCQRTLTQYAKSYMANHSQSSGMVSVLNTFGNHKKNRKRALEICRPFLCHFLVKQYLLSHELDLITYALTATKYYYLRHLRNVFPKSQHAGIFLWKNIFASPFAFDKNGHDKMETWRAKPLRDGLEPRYLLTAKISPPT